MTRKDIQAGFVVTVPNGTQYRIISINGNKYLMKLGSYSTGLHLCDIVQEDLSPQTGMAGITEIYDINGNIIWTKPVTMTIAQIEQALKLSPGSLRIKD